MSFPAMTGHLQILFHLLFTLFTRTLLQPIGFPGLTSVILYGVIVFAIPEDFRLNARDSFFKHGFFQLTFPNGYDRPAFGFQLAQFFDPEKVPDVEVLIELGLMFMGAEEVEEERWQIEGTVFL